jgi:hypothetical protein
MLLPEEEPADSADALVVLPSPLALTATPTVRTTEMIAARAMATRLSESRGIRFPNRRSSQ